mmetsp:Transcript_10843/g.23096  ORF Transcript_10843/g.23096 Transcript_10843/m.23096 type:complete len:573 (+) Transcript_10843:27-1745(+)
MVESDESARSENGLTGEENCGGEAVGEMEDDEDENGNRLKSKRTRSALKLDSMLDASVFYPTEQEFQDPVEYIRSIQTAASATGICKVRPPESWRANLQNRIKGSWRIQTRVQPVHKLVNREHEAAGMQFGFGIGPVFTVEQFKAFADGYKSSWANKKHEEVVANCSASYEDGAISSNSEAEMVEHDFWCVVGSGKEALSVLYANDIHSSELEGGGFESFSSQSGSCSSVHGAAVSEQSLRDKNPWNINSLTNRDETLLRFVGRDRNVRLKGVCEPWMYFGMLFSTFCWHTEDHNLYSINFMHTGGQKVWYGIAQSDSTGFERVFRSVHQAKFPRAKNVFYDLNTMVTPQQLIEAGVKIHRVIQSEGDFIVTFPGAYHAGFSTGFNCAEAVNFALPEWLSFGEIAEKRARLCGKKLLFTNEELVFRLFHQQRTNFQVPRSCALEFQKVLDRVINRELAERGECERLFGAGVMRAEPANGASCYQCGSSCFLSCVVTRVRGIRSGRRMMCLKHGKAAARAGTLRGADDEQSPKKSFQVLLFASTQRLQRMKRSSLELVNGGVCEREREQIATE